MCSLAVLATHVAQQVIRTYRCHQGIVSTETLTFIVDIENHVENAHNNPTRWLRVSCYTSRAWFFKRSYVAHLENEWNGLFPVCTEHVRPTSVRRIQCKQRENRGTHHQLTLHVGGGK